MFPKAGHTTCTSFAAAVATDTACAVMSQHVAQQCSADAARAIMAQHDAQGCTPAASIAYFCYRY